MAGKLKSQSGSKVKSPKKGRMRDSDKDTGYVWGEAGRAKAKQLENKRNSGYRMWENEK